MRPHPPPSLASQIVYMLVAWPFLLAGWLLSQAWFYVLLALALLIAALMA